MLCPNPEALDDAYVNVETHRAMCEWIGVGVGHEKFKLKSEGPSMRVSFGDWWAGVRPWLGKKQWQTKLKALGFPKRGADELDDISQIGVAILSMAVRGGILQEFGDAHIVACVAAAPEAPALIYLPR